MILFLEGHSLAAAFGADSQHGNESHGPQTALDGAAVAGTQAHLWTHWLACRASAGVSQGARRSSLAQWVTTALVLLSLKYSVPTHSGTASSLPSYSQVLTILS